MQDKVICVYKHRLYGAIVLFASNGIPALEQRLFIYVEGISQADVLARQFGAAHEPELSREA